MIVLKQKPDQESQYKPIAHTCTKSKPQTCYQAGAGSVHKLWYRRGVVACPDREAHWQAGILL
jgi:hypothetical protein